MRKRNKLLMIIVSLLLCLTLISSCFVSSIYAKFTKTATAGGSATVKKFGVEVSAEIDEAKQTELESLGATVTVDKVDGKTVSVTITGLQMAPGDYFQDIAHIKMSGQANVDCKLVMDVNLDFEYNNIEGVDGKKPNTFYFPEGIGKSTGTYYFPVKIWCRVDTDKNGTINDNSTREKINCFTPWQNTGPGGVGSTANKVLCKNFDLEFSPTDKKSDGVTPSQTIKSTFKNFKAGDTISLHPRDTVAFGSAVGDANKNRHVQELYFGLEFPYDSSADTNEMATYLAQERDATFTVQFIISIEQT